MNDLQPRDERDAYEEREADSESQRSLQVSFEPFLEMLQHFTKQNCNVELVLNRTADLPIWSTGEGW